ncbi:hypothetical protein TNCV_287151 [Trichonephila clavipes]|nr:hypothetical protein TNCV_287151 [Trichonephila clavipes]
MHAKSVEKRPPVEPAQCRPRHLTMFKLRGPSPKALVQLNSATLIFNHSLTDRTSVDNSVHPFSVPPDQRSLFVIFYWDETL